MVIRPIALVTTFHIVALIVSIIFLDTLKDYNAPQFYLFWLISIGSLCVPIRLSVSDPGFIITDFEKSKPGKQTTALIGDESLQHPSVLNNSVMILPRDDSPEQMKQESRSLPISQRRMELEVNESDNSSFIGDIERVSNVEVLFFSVQNNESHPQEEEIEDCRGKLNSDHISDAETKNVPDLFMRYCTVCHIDQPIRAKHCAKCAHCVLTYDHHCPFLGTCIGEKNRHLFYLYTALQFLECALGIAIAIREVKYDSRNEKWLSHNTDNLLIALVGFGFGLFVLSLLLCHTWLACKNLTTYEILRWRNVHYLASFQKFSSPFDRGCMHNLSDYFCPKAGGKEWRLTE